MKDSMVRGEFSLKHSDSSRVEAEGENKQEGRRAIQYCRNSGMSGNANVCLCVLSVLCVSL